MSHLRESINFGVRSLDGSLVSLSSESTRPDASSSSSSTSTSTVSLHPGSTAADAARASHEQYATTRSATPNMPRHCTTSETSRSEHQQQPGRSEHAQQPHPLASFLVAHANSPPSSPMSHVSAMSSHHASPQMKPADHHQADDWLRSRQTTSSYSSSADGSHGEHTHDFVMPSLTLPTGRAFNLSAGPSSHSIKTSSTTSTGDEHEDLARILIMGRTAAERQTLARLLGHPPRSAGDTDLEASVLSLAPSEPVKKRLRSHDYDFLTSLSCSTPHATFEHVVSDEPDTEALATALAVPFERLASTLSPKYPSATIRLADMVAFDLRNSLELCVMLFSAPALPHELRLARAISEVVTVLPVLILPPAPRDKPQKAGSIAQAVAQQLDIAHVRWTASLGPGDQSTICTLPYELFSQFDNESTSSEPQSLSSSQELPAPSASARGTSSSPSGDLRKLQSFVSSSEGRQWIRRLQVQAFIEWRATDVAAQGLQSRSLDDLPHDWHEHSFASESAEVHSQLDFSARVSRRRLGRKHDDSGLYTSEPHASSRRQDRGDPASLFDVTTPRCTRDLSLFAAWPTSDPVTATAPSGSSYFASPHYVGSSAAATATVIHGDALISDGGDPFPSSLLDLVGLRLRLALVPRNVSGAGKDGAGPTWTWLGACLCAGALLATGFLIGRGLPLATTRLLSFPHSK